MSGTAGMLLCVNCGFVGANVWTGNGGPYCGTCAARATGETSWGMGGPPLTYPLAGRPEDLAEIARLRRQIEDLTSPIALSRTWRRMATSTECGQSWEQYAMETEQRAKDAETEIADLRAKLADTETSRDAWKLVAQRYETARVEKWEPMEKRLAAAEKEIASGEDTRFAMHRELLAMEKRAEAAEARAKALEATAGEYLARLDYCLTAAERHPKPEQPRQRSEEVGTISDEPEQPVEIDTYDPDPPEFTAADIDAAVDVSNAFEEPEQPKCGTCGGGEFAPIHRPFFSEETGHNPYGHEFKPDCRKDGEA